MVLMRGGEKLSVDSDRVGLRVTFKLVGRGVVAAFRKDAFSSRRAALLAKKYANFYWWDSC